MLPSLFIPCMTDPLKLFEDECLLNLDFHSNVNEFDLVNDMNDFDLTEDDSAHERHHDPSNERRTRSVNAYSFEFGNVRESNLYKNFLHPNSRECAYHLSSRDCSGDFRSLFLLTLEKIYDLVSPFMSENWVY